VNFVRIFSGVSTVNSVSEQRHSGNRTQKIKNRQKNQVKEAELKLGEKKESRRAVNKLDETRKFEIITNID